MSKFIDHEKKNELLQLVLKDDKSNIAQATRLACLASTPDPKIKEQVWNEVTNPDSKLSLSMKQPQLESFYSYDQLDLVKPYTKKFFSTLMTTYNSNSF